ncbi:replication initiation and membrane attachment family protein [Oceanobacillus sp. FSL H7-0719]|uniref:replication initiation and membrane attachment family protein n=1 Tax=Oceanobacillus sp. FSL H7-0719 TaxID=2954507 RepID=UPI003247AF21
MLNTIGQLLPVDGYLVILKKPLPVNYLQSLTHLYQPLIGPEALMLYQTLLNDIELQEDTVPQTHHTLMNYMTMPLDKIYESRIKLEGMGLLKSFKKSNLDKTVYTYELQCPFDPNSFFREAMFTTLLYHHVGEQRFNKLKEFFIHEEIDAAGEDITADFQEVFQTVPPNPKAMQHIPVQENDEISHIEGHEGIKWLEQSLRQRMIPVNRVLTKENCNLISQMHIIYDLESFEIDKAVLWALTDENYLDTEEFKRACHDFFKAKNNNKPIRLIEKRIQKQPEAQNNKPQTKEELLIQQLEKISPKELLEDLSSGNFASEQDMRLISNVMTTQGLPAPVMNVLIHYVLLQTNMKLSKAYLEKIASHWSRAKLQTAREAMEFAKKEKASYQQAKQKRTTNYQKQTAKDIVPDWFREGKHLQGKPQITKQQEQAATEEQLRLANLMKQYSEGN